MSTVQEFVAETSGRLDIVRKNDPNYGAYSMLRVILTEKAGESLGRDLDQLTSLSIYELRQFADKAFEALIERFPQAADSVATEQSQIIDEMNAGILQFEQRREQLDPMDSFGQTTINEEEKVFRADLSRKISALGFVGGEFLFRVHTLRRLLSHRS